MVGKYLTDSIGNKYLIKKESQYTIMCVSDSGIRIHFSKTHVGSLYTISED